MKTIDKFTKLRISKEVDIFTKDMVRLLVKKIEDGIKKSGKDDIEELENFDELDLKFCVIHGIKPFQKKNIERTIKMNNKAVIDYIEEKFNLTKEDLKR